jgi:hypothetical protein
MAPDQDGEVHTAISLIALKLSVEADRPTERELVESNDDRTLELQRATRV